MNLDTQRDNLTCFLVKSGSDDFANLVRDLLATKNVDCISISNLTEIGSSLASLLSIMKQCSFVCAILPDSPPSTNIIFEAGLAVGLGKPVLVFERGVVDLPSDLKSVSVARVDNSSVEVIEPIIASFLRTLPVRSLRKREQKRLRTSNPLNSGDNALPDFASLLPPSSEREMEDIVADSFESRGFSVTRSPRRDFGADMSIWSSAIKKRFGNPILVEVKRGRTNRDEVYRIADRLSRMIRHGQGSIALIVASSLDEEPIVWQPPKAPVVVLSLGTLRHLLRSKQLLDELSSKRESFFKWKI
jgi:hypothetical protein